MAKKEVVHYWVFLYVFPELGDCRDYLDEGLDPDPELAVLVVAGLVGQDHTLLKAWVVRIDPVGNPHGTFMHVEERSDTMSSAM